VHLINVKLADGRIDLTLKSAIALVGCHSLTRKYCYISTKFHRFK